MVQGININIRFIDILVIELLLSYLKVNLIINLEWWIIFLPLIITCTISIIILIWWFIVKCLK